MFATGGHELGKLANNSPRPCQLDRLDSWLLQKRNFKTGASGYNAANILHGHF
jgi:hypothetical protein